MLFSSASAVIGSRDLAHFGAANHVVDAVAQRRRAQGLPATSVNWGWWPEGGTTDALDAYYPRIGLDPIATRDAFIALEHLVRSAVAQALVASVDWKVFRRVCEAKGPVPFLADIEEPGAAQPVEPGSAESDFQRAWASTPRGERQDLIMAHVKEQLCRVLGFADAGDIDEHQGFFQMGMDSITALQLTDRLRASLGQPLPATLTFEYPNVGALCRHLAEDLLGAGAAEVNAEAPGLHVDGGAGSDDGAFRELDEDELAALLEKKLKILAEQAKVAP